MMHTVDHDAGPSVLAHWPEGLLDCSARELHRVLPGPTLIHLPGERPQPLFVSVLLHGNEDVGLLALQRVLAKRAGRPLPRALSVFVGNVEAARAGRRFLDHQPDFNRIWGLPEPTTAPQRMAAAVVDAMKARSVALALDLHNNTGRNPLYGCVCATELSHLVLARRFSPLALLIRAPGSLGAAFTPLCPTITCECGEVGNAEGIARAAALIEQCLEEDVTVPQAMPALELYEAVAVLKVPPRLRLGGTLDAPDAADADLLLPHDLEALNFRPLRAGQVLAHAASALGELPLQVVGMGSGESFAGLLERRGRELCLAADTVLAMLTRDERAIRQDCLGYVMRRVPQPAL